MSPLLYATAAGVYAVANRFSGGGLWWGNLTKDHGGPIGGRPIYYSTAALLAAAGATFVAAPALHTEALVSAATALAFGLWRLPSWYHALDMGTVDGTLEGDAEAMWLRGAALIPAFGVIGLAQHGIWGACLGASVGLGLACAITVAYAAAMLTPGDWEEKHNILMAELGAGASWGVALALMLGVQ